MMERLNVGRTLILGIVLTFQLSNILTVVAAQKRAITFEDYIALKSVSDPQLSPDGKWVSYKVSTPSLQTKRNVSSLLLAATRTGRWRALRWGPGPARQSR